MTKSDVSIELLLLRKIEIVTGCANTLVFPVPESCDATSHLFGSIAQFHLLTWIVILFFFLMLISLLLMFKGGGSGGGGGGGH